MRIATQAKNAQSINNQAAKELFQREKDGGIAQRSRLNWRNSVNIDPEIQRKMWGVAMLTNSRQVMTFLLFQNLGIVRRRVRLTVTNQGKGQEE
jgi:hypothetical protein